MCPFEGAPVAMAEIRGVYDGGLFFMCMADYTHRWHRWPEGNRLRAKAEEHWRLCDEAEVSGADS